MSDLQSLLARLIDGRVDFVVVGGFAAVAHGSTLLTQDVDICCDFSPGNLLRLQRAVDDVHPVHRMTADHLPLELTPERFRGLKNLYLDTDIGPLDCLSSVKGLGDFSKVKAASVVIEFDTGSCPVLSVAALIKAKEAMGRPRDRETVLQLRAIQERREGEDP